MGQGTTGGGSIFSGADSGSGGASEGAGAGGLLSGLGAALKKPETQAALGKLQQALAAAGSGRGGAPNEQRQFLQDMLMSRGQPGAGGAGGASPMDTSASRPYVGDIAGFQIDPGIIRMALQRMGIPS